MDFNGIRFYGGAHFLDKTQLQNLREHIASNLDELKKQYSEKRFKNKFGELLGEQNKRIPKEFKEIVEEESLIANKQFYYSTELSPKKLLSDTLMDTIIKLNFIGKPINQFLRIGIN